MAALTPEQVKIIKCTVPVLEQHGKAITASFYDTLLKEVPELNNVFNQSNQANKHQADALAGALYAYASHIDDLGVLSPAVEKICHKHASLYIRPEQYEVVGKYLLRAMGDVLGAALTPEILEAWGAAYWQLANLMIGREAELMKQADGWTDWREFRIEKKVKESEEITSFYLFPTDGKALPSFLPGQYISVMTQSPQSHYTQSRQYSLSDAPNDHYYRISVKKDPGVDPSLPGFISNILHDEKNVGDVLMVSHPFGEFFLDPAKTNTAPIVLLSAGVGLTPMVSIINTLAQRNSRQPITFAHGARLVAARAFHSHLEALAARHQNIRYISFVKESEREERTAGCLQLPRRLRVGRLSREEHLYQSNPMTQYFVCGPGGFMKDVEHSLRMQGVDAGRIHVDIFGTGVFEGMS